MSGEDSWVLDSLVCFLHGPIWNAPLQTFIEEKSLVFDPNMQPTEQNPETQKIHDEYKHLVDYMLGSFMEEMQITPEQFETACMEGRNQQQGDNPFQFHQALFQQIWAANDLKIFIRMMTQRNVELQLQALDLIEKNQLALLSDTEPVDVDTTSPTSSDHTHSDKLSDVEDIIAKSVDKETESPEAAITPEQAHDLDDVADKFERLNLFFGQNNEIDPNDVVSRQEYLRQQRDKIVEIKKKTRAKQLQETVSRRTAQPTTGGRPSSAHVAQKLLENGVNADELPEEDSEVNAALQLRRSLAKRLRTEVVEHN